MQLTDQELLQATGGKWRVRCYLDGEHRRIAKTLFVRAESRELAHEIAREVSGLRAVSASPYDPWSDPAMRGMIGRANENP